MTHDFRHERVARSGRPRLHQSSLGFITLLALVACTGEHAAPPDGGGGGGGATSSDASAPADATAGEADADRPLVGCSEDADCGNGLFCDGAEICDPTSAQAGIDGCVPATPPCGPEAPVCVENGGLDGSGLCALFYESFDEQPDFTSTLHTTNPSQRVRQGDILPVGWNSLYQGTRWSPETGYPDNHASLEILGTNAAMARGGVGRSAVMYRESYSRGWQNWASDSQLIKFLDQDYDEIYVEFHIRFSPEFFGRENAAAWASKFFRVGSFRGTGDEFNGAQGDLGPLAFWGYKRDAYGVRNVLTFRGGPWGENYNFNNMFSGGGSLSYSTHTRGHAVGGGDPQVPNRTGDGYLVDIAGPVEHDQVFGPGDEWTRMAFYVRMNSEVGAADGIYRQWINGERIVNETDIPWIMENADDRRVGWNYFAIGGNDYFQPYPNEERFEDWYAIDDVIVRETPPPGLE